jgi:hypothetical protein
MSIEGPLECDKLLWTEFSSVIGTYKQSPVTLRPTAMRGGDD